MSKRFDILCRKCFMRLSFPATYCINWGHYVYSCGNIASFEPKEQTCRSMCASQSYSWGRRRMPSESPWEASCAYKKTTNNMDAFLWSYCDEVGYGDITDYNIRYAVKFAVDALEYPERGIPLQLVDTHSLWSGEACALTMTGFKDREIMKMGRWVPK